MTKTISTVITADAGLELLSQEEVNQLKDQHDTGVYELFRKCALAVLNSVEVTDEIHELNALLETFSIDVIQQDRGVKLAIENAPASAFVDGVMIRGLKQQVFSVLRDIVFLRQLEQNNVIDFSSTEGSTNAIFSILRNAGAMQAGYDPALVVCWGGHSIPDYEYQYTKEVGYRLGLRNMNIVTGCGTGAMKGPMKGALIAHSKQRFDNGRYIGISEPGIIAVESPNPLVNELMILPDIEKRLEAFVRFGHGIVVFPGGVGTAEEILYILGILLHPANRDIELPLIFTGPAESADYFAQIDTFIRTTLGDAATRHYEIIIDDPVTVARKMLAGLDAVKAQRKASHDAYHFNWQLHIDWSLQQRFDPTHENMRALNLSMNQPVESLAANLRRAFSGIVAGNVKETGLQRIQENGPYQLCGDKQLLDQLDALLEAFVAQNRMKLNQDNYQPCYELVEP